MESTLQAKKIIEVRNLSIKHNYAQVLTNVDLDVEREEFVYVLGKTGSGKSSLMRTLYADLPVEEGSVVIAGYDLNKLKKKEVPMLRRKLGIIFQDFQLLMDRNVYDNLRFVLQATGWTNKDEIHNQITSMVDNVGMTRRIDHMPYQLSGGEQQRIAIARALLNTPEVILADEPTGNLDADTSEEIIEILEHINKTTQTTILMNTHDLPLILKYPHKILKCEGGTLLEMKIGDNRL